MLFLAREGGCGKDDYAAVVEIREERYEELGYIRVITQ